MSAIDYEIEDFFGKIASIRMDKQTYENWCENYEAFRYKYPQWITKTNEAINIYDMDDNHINNTISMLEERDKNNSWIAILKQEKNYRELKNKIKELNIELSAYQKVANLVF